LFHKREVSVVLVFSIVAKGVSINDYKPDSMPRGKPPGWFKVPEFQSA